MFAILALLVFAIGLVLELLDEGNNWVALFLGLALLAIHFVWRYTPWDKNPAT